MLDLTGGLFRIFVSFAVTTDRVTLVDDTAFDGAVDRVEPNE